MKHVARQGLKGIALSGFGQDEDVRRSRDAGFATHITKPVNVHVLQQRRLHAVIDFSSVRMITSSNLAKLLKLRRQMNAADSRLVLCGANEQQVWGAFLVTNHDKLFEFTGDVTTALTTLQLKADNRHP